MDFTQRKLSGYTRTDPDGSRQETDFTTSPWTVRHFDAAGNLVEEYRVTLDKTKPAGQQVVRLD